MCIIPCPECTDVLSPWNSGAGAACAVYSTRSEDFSMDHTIDSGIHSRTPPRLRSGKVVVCISACSLDRSGARSTEGMYKQSDVKDLN